MFLLAFMAPAIGGAAEATEVSVQRISDRVLVLTVPAPQATNVIALRSERGVVVIDTEVSPALAAPIRRRIESEFGDREISYLINTHEHGDHTYGNQEFSNAIVIAHQSVGAAMLSAEPKRLAMAERLQPVIGTLAERLEILPAGSEAAEALDSRIGYYRSVADGLGEGFRLTPPGIGFSDILLLDLGDLSLELRWFGVAHSRSDILVYCPEEELLVTGDLFASSAMPYIDTERIEAFPRWLDNLEFITDPDLKLAAIVPGHGELLSVEDLASVKRFVLEQQALYKGRRSGYSGFRTVVEERGLDAGLEALRGFALSQDEYFLIHSEIDSYGFRMMMDGELEKALRLFTALTELFPDNDVAFDSLGEVRLRLEDTELAAAAFRRALELNAENRNAQRRLAGLGG